MTAAMANAQYMKGSEKKFLVGTGDVEEEERSDATDIAALELEIIPSALISLTSFFRRRLLFRPLTGPFIPITSPSSLPALGVLFTVRTLDPIVLKCPGNSSLSDESLVSVSYVTGHRILPLLRLPALPSWHMTWICEDISLCVGTVATSTLLITITSLTGVVKPVPLAVLRLGYTSLLKALTEMSVSYVYGVLPPLKSSNTPWVICKFRSLG